MQKTHLFNRSLAVTISCFALCSAAPALAQNVPSSADASRASKAAEMPEAPDYQPDAAIVENNAQTQVEAPEGADQIILTLDAIILEGNTRFSEAELRPLYADKLGKKVALTEIYRIAADITHYYRTKGYVLSVTHVPPQELDEHAKVRLSITEGFIHSVQTKGTIPDGLMKKIRLYADKILQEKPASIRTIERQLLLINDLPGIIAKSTLTAAEGIPGGADMILALEHKPFYARANADNYGNTYLGPERLSGAAQINSMPMVVDGIIDSVIVSGLTTANVNELNHANIVLNKSIGSNGLKASVGAAHTATSPSLPGTLGQALDTRGSAEQLSMNLQYPIVRSREWNWSIQGGMDATESRTNFAPGFEAIETRDHIRALRITSFMDGLDPWGGYNNGSLEFSRGLDIWGASNAGDANLSRTQGQPIFTKFFASVSRIQAVAKNITLLTATEGQWSDDALLSPEEYGVGGYRFGRGFDSSEITGDRGAAAKIELAYHSDWQNHYLDDINYFTFYDIGRTWDIDASAGVDARRSISSAGGGVRLTALDRFQTEMYLAKPLTGAVFSRAADKQEDWRALMNVSVEY